VLCALVAELHVALRESSWPLFEKVDLLDFPGARSREKYRSMADRAENAQKAARRPCELFIRGKIAVLFQRYAEERELTSMLLCMAGSNAEVKDLGALVREWVALTHGGQPEQRRGQRNALFFVLTKADQDFIAKDGEDEAALRSRWQRRIYASMIELYQRDGWLDDWDGQPFRNTLLLRNPGIEQSHLVEYRTEQRGGAAVRVQPLVEIGYAPELQARLGALRQHFVTDERVQRYVEEPARAFDALLALNDGGIAYIAERIAAVCDPQTKLMQIRGRLLQAAEEFRRRFGAFYDAGAAASRDQKRVQAFDLAHAIGRSEAGSAGFGPFLRSFALREAEMRELYLTVLHDAKEALPAALPVDAPASGSIFDLDQDRPERSRASFGDRAELFAEAALHGWIIRLREAAADAAGRLRRDLSAEQAHLFVQELIAAAQRLGIANRIAEEVRAAGAVTDADWEHAAERAASVAAVRLNALLSDLGYGNLPPQRRPQVPPAPRQANRRAFESPDVFEGLPKLADRPSSPARIYRLAWPRIVLPAENDAAKPGAPIVLQPQRPQPWAKPAPVAELVAQAELRSAPLQAAPEPAAKPPAQPAAWKGSTSARTWLAILLIALLLPATSWLLASWNSAERTAEIPAPQASTRSFTEEWVRAFLARDPDAPSATAEAALFEAAGHSDLGGLLYRHAARKGEPKAAMAIARMYEPDGFDPARSPFATPDADQAAAFYEQAAEAGDAEAQYRLGRLLLSGRTSGEADAERGAVWLQRAAGQGHAQARSTLERLKVN
jgi:Putative bacterial virulence factor/Sel1 repeat